MTAAIHHPDFYLPETSEPRTLPDGQLAQIREQAQKQAEKMDYPTLCTEFDPLYLFESFDPCLQALVTRAARITAAEFIYSTEVEAQL